MFTSFRVSKSQLTKTRVAGRAAARFKALRGSFDLILSPTRTLSRSHDDDADDALIPFRVSDLARERCPFSAETKLRRRRYFDTSRAKFNKTIHREVDSATINGAQLVEESLRRFASQ